MFEKFSQGRWLILSIFLTVLGNPVKVSGHPVLISSQDPETARTFWPSRTQTSSLAQVPDPIPPKTPEAPLPKFPIQIESPQLDITPPEASGNESESPEPYLRVKINKFEFVGYTAFTKEELEEVVKPFTQRPITFAELLQAEKAVTDKYVQAGYINSGAVILAGQNLKDGVVRIQIIEGEIEDIQVTVTGRLNPNYVRSRLVLATGKPFDQYKLLRALQLLQLDPLIAIIKAEVSAGPLPQASLLTVSVTQADSFSIESFANNSRAPNVGSFQRGLRLKQGNLLGFGDGLNASYTNSDGSNNFSFNYTIPFNARNGRIQLTTELTDTRVVESPFDDLDIMGESQYYELTVRQPIVQFPTQELALGLTFYRQNRESELLGEPFPLSPGANEKGETRISAIRLFQDWVKRNQAEVFAVRSQFSLGVGAFNATINDDLPDSRFFSWRGQGQYVRRLAKNSDSLLVVRTNIQLADRGLLPVEQFRIGGVNSVRGYRQDLSFTDNGLFLGTEVRLPIMRWDNVEGVLQIVPFVDFGVGWNSSDLPEPEHNSLAGVGFGLLWQMSDRLSARFDWGIPLMDVTSEEKTLQENGLYFTIDAKF